MLRVKLSASISRAHKLIIIAEVSCLVTMIAAAQGDAIVLDPILLDDFGLRDILAALTQMPIPIILYSALTPLFARRIVRFAKTTASEVVLKGVDDDPEQLRQILARMSPLDSPLDLGPLDDAIARLQPRLRLNVQALFARFDSADSPTRLAADSGMARRSLSRHLGHAGINSARLLIAGARIIRVYSRLADTRIPLREVAAMAGCRDVRSLDNQCYALVNRTAREVRSGLTRQEFVTLFVETLCTTVDTERELTLR